MPITVNGPEGVTVNFPDGTDAATIDKAMRQHFGGKPPPDESLGKPATAEELRGQSGAQFLKGIPVAGAYVDQAGAALSAAAHPITGVGNEGETFGERYTKNLKREQEIARQAEKEKPAMSTALQLGGGVASTLPLAMTGVGARVLGLTGGNLPSQMVRGAVSNAGISAADAVARGNDPATSGVIGGAAGALAPPAGRLIGAAVAPVVNSARGIMNPTGEAARRVATGLERDITSGTVGLTPQEFQAAAAAGTPVNLMDAGGETVRSLARSAANTSPEGRAVLNRAIDDRFETQGNRITDWLRTTFNYPNADAQRAALDQANRAATGPAYTLARQASDARNPAGLWSPELERLTSSPDVVQAMQSGAQSGKGRAVAEGAGGFNPGVTFDNGMLNFRRGPNGVPSYPDLQFWDYSYRELRDAADKAFRAGSGSLGNSLKTQANLLRTELDRLAPEFGKARSTAASFFGANDALEAGQNFVTSKLSNREARQALASMTPQERQLFQDGFVDRYIQTMRENPNRRTVVGKVGGSDAADERLAIALGPQRARELEAIMHVERVMDLARHSVQGNSTTARQLAELGLAGGAFELSGGGLDPQSVMNAALVYGAARGKRSIDHRVSEQVARLLTSNNPGQALTGLRLLAQPNMLGALRVTDANLASLAARGAEPALANRP